MPSSAPPIPQAELTDAPNTYVGHGLEEPYSTSALPLVDTAFGEGDVPLEMAPSSAPIPINPSETQAQHAASSSPPSMLLAHQADDVPMAPEAPLAPVAPHDPPLVDVGQGRDDPTSIGGPPLTPSPTTRTQRSPSPTLFIAPSSPPPSTTSYLPGHPYPSAPPLPPPPSAPYAPIPPPPPPSLPETSAPPDLTPGQITKAQKHCRFAISALDYEDVTQARKELHAALTILNR
jgi:vacuolar protein sorting-associated protein VTA1